MSTGVKSRNKDGFRPNSVRAKRLRNRNTRRQLLAVGKIQELFTTKRPSRRQIKEERRRARKARKLSSVEEAEKEAAAAPASSASAAKPTPGAPAAPALEAEE